MSMICKYPLEIAQGTIHPTSDIRMGGGSLRLNYGSVWQIGLTILYLMYLFVSLSDLDSWLQYLMIFEYCQYTAISFSFIQQSCLHVDFRFSGLINFCVYFGGGWKKNAF